MPPTICGTKCSPAMLGSTSSGALSTIPDIISNTLDKNYTMKQAASELGALMNEL